MAAPCLWYICTCGRPLQHAGRGCRGVSTAGIPGAAPLPVRFGLPARGALCGGPLDALLGVLLALPLE
eukprot:10400890-Lingulodinium_polyedra.AAC.1